MSNDFDDATQLGSIGHNPSVPSQPGQQQPVLIIAKKLVDFISHGS